jgi:hypothetical protein
MSETRRLEIERPRPVPPYSCENRQDKTCQREGETTYTSRRTISLAEGVEDKVQLVLGNTNTRISDTELESNTLVVHSQKTSTERNLALTVDLGRRELDGVTDEVGDDLAKTKRVTDELIWDIGLNIVGEIELVLRGANDEGLEDTKDGLTERVGDSFHRHATSFDYGIHVSHLA